MQQEEFEKYLQNRKFEGPNPFFAERIITTAIQRKENNILILFSFFGDSIKAILPRPAFAVSLMLIVAIAFGFTNVPDKNGQLAESGYFEEDGAAL